MSELKKKYISPFDLDVMHIEQCDFHVTQVIVSVQNIVHTQECQIEFYSSQLIKLGYVFQVKKLKKEIG